MNKVEEIVEIVEKESPGLLDSISREDGITKESLVRKVLALSHGQMVRTHQSEGARHDSDVVVKRRNFNHEKHQRSNGLADGNSGLRIAIIW